MGTPRDMLKKYGVSLDQANREEYLEQKINEIRLKLDKVSMRIHNGEKLENLSPKAKDVLEGLKQEKKDLSEQLDNLYKQQGEI